MIPNFFGRTGISLNRVLSDKLGVDVQAQIGSGQANPLALKLTCCQWLEVIQDTVNEVSHGTNSRE